MIQNHDKPITVLTIVDQDGNKSPNGGKLMFHRYGEPVLPERDSLRLGRIWTSRFLLRRRRRGFSCNKQCFTRAARLFLLPGNGVIWSSKARS